MAFNENFRYDLELKQHIISLYNPYICGYKALARKFGLKRDTVRDFIRQYKKSQKE
ncbi:MAG: hypothetical protein ACTTJ3_02995 [Treponema sp.]